MHSELLTVSLLWSDSRSRMLLEKLIVAEVLEKLFAGCGTQRFQKYRVR
jgi:hypothetical protein